jgi:chromosome segregation ATPase
MTEETESLVLELLRKIRGDIAELREEVADLKLRMSAVEQGLFSLGAQINQMQVLMGSFHRRADRIDMRTDDFDTRLRRFESETDRRLARIEERLKLTDA